jgi:copper chaperone NosL
MKAIILTPLLFILLWVVTACGGAAKAELAPPEIHYGADLCEFCGMIISDSRYAAGYLTSDGEQHIFDDIGNMFQSHLQKQDEVRAFFVHDYEEQRWIRAETAHYVLSPKLVTPMLHGLAAHVTAEKAEALAAEIGGEVFTFEELLAHYEAKVGLAPEDHSQHQHTNDD